VEEALFRELKEEIGLERQDVKVLGSTQGWLRYRLPRQYVRDRCIGQKQRWFLLQLVAEETKLRFDSTNQPSSTGGGGRTIGPLCARSWYFKRRVYIRALHDLGGLMFPQGLPPYRNGGRRSAPKRAFQNGFATARMTIPTSSSEGTSLNARNHLAVWGAPICGRNRART